MCVVPVLLLLHWFSLCGDLAGLFSGRLITRSLLALAHVNLHLLCPLLLLLVRLLIFVCIRYNLLSTRLLLIIIARIFLLIGLSFLLLLGFLLVLCCTCVDVVCTSNRPCTDSFEIIRLLTLNSFNQYNLIY